MKAEEKEILDALELFKKRFSIFLISLLDINKTGNWEPEFCKALYNSYDNSKQNNWIKSVNRKKYKELIDLIDFQYMEIFINNKTSLFKPIFKNEIFYLPTWIHEISEVRHLMFHFNPILRSEAIQTAWLYMERIAEIIKDEDLQNGLKVIKDKRDRIIKIKEAFYSIKKWFIQCSAFSYFPLTFIFYIVILFGIYIFTSKNDTLIQTDPSKYNILILPFRNPEDNNKKSTVGEELCKRLQEKNEINKLGLTISYLPCDSFKFKPEMAIAIGEKIKGINMVIWGTDSKPEDLSHQIYFHYVSLLKDNSNIAIPDKGKTEKYETPRLSDITEGELNLEIDDIIYWFLGRKFYINKDYKNALKYFKKIKNDKFLNGVLFFDIANCYYLQGFIKYAKVNYENSLKADSEFAPTYNNYALLLYRYFNKLEDANKYFSIGLKKEPEDVNLNMNYAIFLHSKKNNLEKAEEHYRKVIEIDPKYTNAYTCLARLISEYNHDYNNAKILLKKALECSPNNPVIYNCLGNVLEDSKDFLESKKYFKKNVELDPKNPVVLFNYARILFLTGEYDESRNLLEKSIITNPKDASLHYSLSCILKDVFKEYQKAKENYLIAIKIDPSVKNDNDDSFYKFIGD